MTQELTTLQAVHDLITQDYKGPKLKGESLEFLLKHMIQNPSDIQNISRMIEGQVNWRVLKEK